MRKTIVIVILLLLKFNFCNSQCNELLKYGIFDIEQSHLSSFQYYTLLKLFTEKNYTSHEDAQRFEGEIGVPVGDFPVKLGFNQSNENFTTWYQDLKLQVQTKKISQVQFDKYTRNVSPVILNAFNECMKVKGLHVKIEGGYDPNVFTILIDYNSPGGTDPNITSFNPGSNCRCDEQVVNVSINGSGRTVKCHRLDKQPINITINASTYIVEGRSIYLPAIENIQVVPSIDENLLIIIDKWLPGQEKSCNEFYYKVQTEFRNYKVFRFTQKSVRYIILSGFRNEAERNSKIKEVVDFCKNNKDTGQPRNGYLSDILISKCDKVLPDLNLQGYFTNRCE